ncbi:MAG TPA: PEP-CTERM sorting domain-containing protein [Candidatus Acidoferrales bacterium]
MRKSLWIIVAVLLVAIGAPVSHADSTDYTLSFSGGNPNPTSGGTVVFDDSTDTYTTFLVDFTGLSFDFSGSTSADIPTTGTWFGCAFPGDTGPCGTMALLQVGSALLTSSGIPSGSAKTNGTYALTAVTAPEPSSYALMLLGVGLVFVMRKRVGQGLPQAS